MLSIFSKNIKIFQFLKYEFGIIYFFEMNIRKATWIMTITTHVDKIIIFFALVRIFHQTILNKTLWVTVLCIWSYRYYKQNCSVEISRLLEKRLLQAACTLVSNSKWFLTDQTPGFYQKLKKNLHPNFFFIAMDFWYQKKYCLCLSVLFVSKQKLSMRERIFLYRKLSLFFQLDEFY